MAEIYNSATATLIVCDSPNANCPLFTEQKGTKRVIHGNPIAS
jgi:hypothetical protein